MTDEDRRPAHAYVRDQRRAAWSWFQNTILDDFVEPGIISPTEGMIYFALCRFANNQGESWPSAKTLGKKAGLSDRAAQRAIQRLEAVGLISIERRQDERGNRPSVYVLLEPSDVARGGDSGSPPPDALSPGVANLRRQGGDSGSPEQDTDKQEPKNKNGRSLDELIAATEADERLAAELKRRERAGFGQKH